MNSKEIWKFERILDNLIILDRIASACSGPNRFNYSLQDYEINRLLQRIIEKHIHNLEKMEGNLLAP